MTKSITDLRKRIRRLLIRLWPPYEKSLADAWIRSQTPQDDSDRWLAIDNETRTDFPFRSGQPNREIELVINQIGEWQSRRLETIENKASSYISGISIAISISAVVPILFSS